MNSIPIFLTQKFSCSYLENELAQSLFVHPSFPLSTDHYGELIKRGYRRSGNEVYSPHCPYCSACRPARVPTQQFKPNRSQKRCLQKNVETRATIKPALFDWQHFALFQRYQAGRHSDGSMATMSPEDYINFLSSDWCETSFVEFSINDELAAVAVIDQLQNAWSAVYTFFEPKFSNHGLGVYAVLWGIQQAKLQDKQYYYLGFWIENCRKMAYKINYRPLQLLINNQWVDIKE